MKPAGRLIGVVGPSGVGKDSVMVGLAEADPDFGLVRRVITRDPSLGGEDYDAVTEQEFDRLQGEGAFCLSWQAHDLRYGIPVQVIQDVADGRFMLVNLSRSVLAAASAAFPGFVALCITAKPETIMTRLAGRGRESAEEIARRASRVGAAIPSEVESVTISNDSTLDVAIDAARAALQPVRA